MSTDGDSFRYGRDFGELIGRLRRAADDRFPDVSTRIPTRIGRTPPPIPSPSPTSQWQKGNR